MENRMIRAIPHLPKNNKVTTSRSPMTHTVGSSSIPNLANFLIVVYFKFLFMNRHKELEDI